MLRISGGSLLGKSGKKHLYRMRRSCGERGTARSSILRVLLKKKKIDSYQNKKKKGKPRPLVKCVTRPRGYARKENS